MYLCISIYYVLLLGRAWLVRSGPQSPCVVFRVSVVSVVIPPPLSGSVCLLSFFILSVAEGLPVLLTF